jgi:CHASE2 domain-containing sensor protein
MDPNHERILTLIAAALLGALLGGPALTLTRALLKAVGQLAVVTLLAIGVVLLVQHGWPPPWMGVNPRLPTLSGATEVTVPNPPASGPWWQPAEEAAP